MPTLSSQRPPAASPGLAAGQHPAKPNKLLTAMRNASLLMGLLLMLSLLIVASGRLASKSEKPDPRKGLQ